MPVNRRRIEITAPAGRWQLLGRLLEERRKELGYTYRVPGFERDSGVNRRMAADIEKAAKDRINRFMPGTLHVIARGYRVTEESVRAVLRGEAGELTPVPAGPRTLPPAEPPPFADKARVEANRPFFDVINERRVELAFRGVAYPSGAEMFGEGTEEAEAWDGRLAHLPVSDRVHVIADTRRRRADRAGPGAGTGTAGA